MPQSWRPIILELTNEMKKLNQEIQALSNFELETFFESEKIKIQLNSIASLSAKTPVEICRLYSEIPWEFLADLGSQISNPELKTFIIEKIPRIHSLLIKILDREN